MSEMNAKAKFQLNSKILSTCLWLCGSFITFCGFTLFLLLIMSIVDPNYTIKMLVVGESSKLATKFDGSLIWSSWAQTAVAFGMHSYADVNAGIAMIKISHSGPKRFPSTVSVWNMTRFVISGLWLLKIIQGIFEFNRNNNIDMLTFTPLAKLLLIILLVDTILIRPVSVYIHRKFDDAFPLEPFEEYNITSNYTTIQKYCNFVFFYEAILSGCSGAVYFIFPELFFWLYDYPNSLNDPVSIWCLSQFGVLVMTFGLYQMNCDIDRQNTIILWWLILDFVWMFFFYIGTAELLGPWNPLTGSGANFWCHSAFHADSTLALARTLFLYESWTKKKSKVVTKVN